MDLLIKGQKKDLGGFSVFRVLPTAKKRFLGPFVFVDHMGPLQLNDQVKFDVRPHPHIGLSTVTYLFAGKGLHRDSLGTEASIYPGDVNLMVAGDGIVHSEHSSMGIIHGLQIWISLPLDAEFCSPDFFQYKKEEIPRFQIAPSIGGELIIGRWKNLSSPVKTFTRTFFAILRCQAETSEMLSFPEKEIGIFVVSGSAKINGQNVEEQDLLIVADPSQIELSCQQDCLLAVLGGMPHPEPRYIWWNFVSSKKETIYAAAEKWKKQEIGKVMGEDDFIPLPGDPIL